MNAPGRPEPARPRLAHVFLVTAVLVAVAVVVVYVLARLKGQWPVGHPWGGAVQLALVGWAVMTHQSSSLRRGGGRITAVVALVMGVMGCSLWVYLNVIGLNQ